MNYSFDNHSLIINILIQKEKQEENSIKSIKENEKKHTQQMKSYFINGIQNQNYIETNKIEIEKAHV